MFRLLKMCVTWCSLHLASCGEDSEVQLEHSSHSTSLSRHRHFLRAVSIVALSWTDMTNGSLIDDTVFSVCSARFQLARRLLPSCPDYWTRCPLWVLVYRFHKVSKIRIMSFSVIHSMSLFPSYVTRSTLSDRFTAYCCNRCPLTEKKKQLAPAESIFVSLYWESSRYECLRYAST